MGELTNDDFDTLSGKREHLSGKIQERYGLSKDAVEEQISKWENKIDSHTSHI